MHAHTSPLLYTPEAAAELNMGPLAKDVIQLRRSVELNLALDDI